MRLKLYKDIIFFGFRQLAVYRTEVWVAVFTKILRLGSVLLLWSVILKTAPSGQNINNLLPYFLIADSVQVLVGGEWIRLGRQMIDEIKNGSISNYLLKPIHPISFMYARYTGNRGVEVILAIIALFLALFLFPIPNLNSVFVFLLTLPVSLAVSLAFNVITGNLAFWMTEADGVKNGVTHVIRVFGGSLIPLSFFHGILKTIMMNSPFPIFAYLPAVMLQQGPTSDNLHILLISAIWAIILLPLSLIMWRKGVRRYEAIGI